MKNLIPLFILAFAFQNLSGQITTIFSDDFEAMQLGPGWVSRPNLQGTNGQVAVLQGFGFNSNRGVILGKTIDGTLTKNALDLNLDLQGQTNVRLAFLIRDNFEETNQEDGIFLSDNGGVTFHQVYRFRGQDWCDNTWGIFPPFDIDALAASVGLELTSQFVIRFQQYDDSDFFSGGDADGLVFDDVSVYSAPPNYASLPFSDDFDNTSGGQLGQSWSWVHAGQTIAPLENTIKPSGFVGILDGQGFNNSKGVFFGKACDDGATSNALDLHLNLEGESDVQFSFLIRDNFEETNDKDGLYFSDDGGNTFHQVYSFRGQDWCNNVWGAFPPFDVDALAAAAGLSLTSQFIIRFQQFDDADGFSGGDADGLAIDAVSVVSRPPVYASLPFSDDFDNTSGGQLGQSWNWVHADQTIAPLENTIKPTGFVGILDGQGFNNSKGVFFGKACDDGATSNALDLHLNLEGESDVQLSFLIRDNFEETHDKDGLYFSDDGGNTFHQVYSFRGQDWCNNAWGAFPPFDVDVLAAAAGLSLTSQFIIRFQQFDDADGFSGGDADGLAIDAVSVRSRAPVYTSLPFSDDFDNTSGGQFGQSWNWVHADQTITPLENTIKPTGFVGILDGQGFNNSKGVFFGKACDDGATSNALDLHLNLEGESDVQFSFLIRDNFEETNDKDGLYFSDDGGNTFHQVYSFRGQDWCNNVWGAFPPFDVDALAAVAGLSLTSQFIIRFQQFDDADGFSGGDADGLAIDAVSVVSRPPVYASLPFSDDFDNTSGGQFGQSWSWVHADQTIAPLENTIKPTGFVGILDATGFNFSKGVFFGKACDDGATSNALDLHLDLAGQSNVHLSFKIKDNFEELNDQDGLYFSNDGGNSFKKIYTIDFEAIADNFFIELGPINLDSLVSLAGLEYSAQSLLRFQQFDDADGFSGGDADGFTIDDITIEGLMTAVSDPNDVQLKYQVYPNPAANQVYIKEEGSQRLPEAYRILDVHGRTLKTGIISSFDQAISLQDLPKGTLLLQLDRGTSREYVRLIKQ